MSTSGNRDEPYDRDAVEKAFADLVAGYHLTSDRPEQVAEPPAEKPASGWADEHPLFRYDGPDDEPAPPPEPVEHYEPPAPEALPRPGWPVLVGLLGMGYAVLVMLAVVVGVQLPPWAAWLGLAGFVLGFVVLVSHLPRHRPPGDDGAVV